MMAMLFAGIVTVFAENPYMEVVEGSFSGTEAKVRITFPDAGKVSVRSDATFTMYYGKEYMTTSFQRYDDIIVKDNTITVPFSFKTAQERSERKFNIYIASSSLKIDGVDYEDPFRIYLEKYAPHMELVGGSMKSGSISAKITVPFADSIVSTNRSFYYLELLYDGARISRVSTDKIPTQKGSSITVNFEFNGIDANVGDCAVKIGRYSLKFDEISCEEYILPFAGYSPTVIPEPEYEPWRTNPYAEVIRGSLNDGLAKIRIVFPNAESVTTAKSTVYLRYGSKAIKFAYAEYGDVKCMGNTLIATFDNFEPGAEMRKYSVEISGNDLVVDGDTVKNGIRAHLIEYEPYVELVEGTPESGSMTFRYTAPYADAITTSGYSFYTIKLLYNGCTISTVGMDKVVVPKDSTLLATFSFKGQKFEINDCSIRIDRYSFSEDGLACADMTLPIKGYEKQSSITLPETETWRTKPYADMVSGKISDGFATMRIVFPNADKITMNGGSLFLKYGNETVLSLRASESGVVKGNSIVFLLNGYEPETEDRKYNFMFYPNILIVDGDTIRNTINVRIKDFDPYAEIVSGSLENGKMNVRMVFPYADKVVCSDRSYYEARLLYAGKPIGTVKSTNFIADSDNSFCAEFSFETIGTDLSKCRFLIDSYAIRIDDRPTDEMTLYVKGNEPEAVEFDPRSVNYFYIKNLTRSEAHVYRNYGITESTLEYTTDSTFRSGWRLLTSSSIDLPANGKVFFRAIELGNEDLNSGKYDAYFLVNSQDDTFEYAVGGDITTLLNARGNISKLTTPEVFQSFFAHQRNLTDVSDLKLTSDTLSKGCYSMMFADCEKLVAGPELTAMTLAESCYSSMFTNCISLREIELPAYTLADFCYAMMFDGCSNLIRVKAGFTDWNYSGGSTDSWMINVNTEDGVFECYPGVAERMQQYESIPFGWSVENLTSARIVIPAWGYTTYYQGFEGLAYIMPEGLEGYTVSANQKRLNLSQEFIGGEIVNKEIPLLIKGEPGVYTVTFTDEISDRIILSSNDLIGSDRADIFYPYERMDYYSLGLNAMANIESVGFYLFTDSVNGYVNQPKSAFLIVRDNTDKVPAYYLNEDYSEPTDETPDSSGDNGDGGENGDNGDGGETGGDNGETGGETGGENNPTDGIEGISIDENAEIYNLNGIKSGKNAKGIVIINGKKYLLQQN